MRRDSDQSPKSTRKSVPLIFLVAMLAIAVAFFFVFLYGKEEGDQGGGGRQDQRSENGDQEDGFLGKSNEVVFKETDDLYGLMMRLARSNSADDLWLMAKISSYCSEYAGNPATYEADTRKIIESIGEERKELYAAARSTIMKRCRGFAALNAKDDVGEAATLLYETRAARAGSIAAEVSLLSKSAPLSPDAKYLNDLMNRVAKSRDRDAYLNMSLVILDDRVAPIVRGTFGDVSADNQSVLAWNMAACTLGLDCSPGGDLMTTLCSQASFEWCTNQDFISAAISQQKTLEEVERLKSAVSSIIEKGDKQ